MNKYLLIAIFTTVAVLGGLVLKGNRDALLREIDEAKSQVVQLERQAQQATQALQARDELDKQRFKEMSDAKNRSTIFVISSLLALSACSSMPAAHLQCQPLPAPPAWMMQESPRLQPLLDRIIYVSESK